MKSVDTTGVRYMNRILLCSTLLLAGCDENEVSEIYLEGEPIPGIEIFFPMGFYDAEPLMPKISPDGKKILFSGPASLPEWKGLWVMDLESQAKTLLHPSGRYGDWAPSSDSVVFNIDSEIFKININGSGLSQLTFPIEVQIGGLTYNSSSFFADWGIHGISYYLSIDYRTGEDGVRVISNLGEELVVKIKMGEPDWHPVQNKIIGIRGISSTSSETIFPIYNLDNGNFEDTLAAIDNQLNQFPRFSPSENSISFFNSSGIFLLDQNTLLLKRILPNHLYNSNFNGSPQLYTAFPSWHPDGKRIVYEHFLINKSNRVDDQLLVEGTISFYMVDADTAMALSNLD